MKLYWQQSYWDFALGYFFEGLNILISTFCACADGFQGLPKAFHYPIYTIINFLFASLELLTNFENLTETPSPIPFPVIGRCSLMSTLIGCRENAQELQGASNVIYRRPPGIIFSI
jgi:hypothetical protein